MKHDGLTSEQKERLSKCHTPEEVLAFTQEEGYELSDEDLESVVGGAFWGEEMCVKCGYTGGIMYNPDKGYSKCPNCGAKWSIRE